MTTQIDPIHWSAHHSEKAWFENPRKTIILYQKKTQYKGTYNNPIYNYHNEIQTHITFFTAASILFFCSKPTVKVTRYFGFCFRSCKFQSNLMSILQLPKFLYNWNFFLDPSHIIAFMLLNIHYGYQRHHSYCHPQWCKRIASVNEGVERIAKIQAESNMHN